MISAFRRAGSFRGDSAVTTWLHRIVVNACLDRMRRRAARPATAGADQQALEVMAAARAAPTRRRTATRRWTCWPRCGCSRRTSRPRWSWWTCWATRWRTPARCWGCRRTVKSRCSRGRARLLPHLSHLRGDRGIGGKFRARPNRRRRGVATSHEPSRQRREAGPVPRAATCAPPRPGGCGPPARLPGLPGGVSALAALPGCWPAPSFPPCPLTWPPGSRPPWPPSRPSGRPTLRPPPGEPPGHRVGTDHAVAGAACPARARPARPGGSWPPAAASRSSAAAGMPCSPPSARRAGDQQRRLGRAPRAPGGRRTRAASGPRPVRLRPQRRPGASGAVGRLTSARCSRTAWRSRRPVHARPHGHRLPARPAWPPGRRRAGRGEQAGGRRAGATGRPVPAGPGNSVQLRR